MVEVETWHVPQLTWLPAHSTRLMSLHVYGCEAVSYFKWFVLAICECSFVWSYAFQSKVLQAIGIGVCTVKSLGRYINK